MNLPNLERATNLITTALHTSKKKHKLHLCYDRYGLTVDKHKRYTFDEWHTVDIVGSFLLGREDTRHFSFRRAALHYLEVEESWLVGLEFGFSDDKLYDGFKMEWRNGGDETAEHGYQLGKKLYNLYFPASFYDR